MSPGSGRAKLKDFVDMWLEMDMKEKDRVLRFLLKAYGNNLLTYMRFIDSTPDENIKVGGTDQD